MFKGEDKEKKKNKMYNAMKKERKFWEVDPRTKVVGNKKRQDKLNRNKGKKYDYEDYDESGY